MLVCLLPIISHSFNFNGCLSIASKEENTVSETKDLKSPSTVIPNGKADTADLSAAPVSDSQKTQPTSNPEPPAKPPRSPEAKGAAERISAGKTASVTLREWNQPQN